MYRKLIAKIYEKNIAKQDIAKSIGVNYNTILAKLNGKQPFKLDEAFKIRELYFPNETIDHLFFDGSNFKKSV